MKETIHLYTDGAASGNPGPGGFGVIMICGSRRKEISEGYELTTNNRMELLAVIRGLESIKWRNAHVIIYTDSKYVSEPVNKKWIFEWERKQFKKKKNSDLWEAFLKLFRQHDVEIQWIKGHNNNTENERCDNLARDASLKKNLNIDQGYINDKGILL